MKAFSGDKKKKEFYVKRMDEHIRLDNLVQGQGWENGKGCFVGCTLENYSHSEFEDKGIGPLWLAHLADCIFEGLSKKDAKWFASNFYKKMKVGVDLDLVRKEFLIFINEMNLEAVKNLRIDDSLKKEVIDSIEYVICGIYFDDKFFLSSANSAAHSAADSADSAYSAYSAYSADSAHSAAYSTYSAAQSANSAAHSAHSANSAANSAARSAAHSANSAANSAAHSVYSAAYSAAELAHYKKQAVHLLLLLSGEV